MATTVYADCTACCQPCVVTDCCACVPTTLYVVFGSPLDDMGTVTLTYNSMTELWEGSGTTANCPTADVDIEFECTSPPDFTMRTTIDGNIGTGGAVATDCDPFECTVVVALAGCDPSASVTGVVTETAP